MSRERLEVGAEDEIAFAPGRPELQRVHAVGGGDHQEVAGPRRRRLRAGTPVQSLQRGQRQRRRSQSGQQARGARGRRR